MGTLRKEVVIQAPLIDARAEAMKMALERRPPG